MNMKIKDSILVQFALFASLVVISVFSYCYLFQFLPAQERMMKKGLFEKIAAVTVLSKPSLIKALETQDDITLLSSIESISSIEDVNGAYILDQEGKVVMHNKTTEWGAVYKDELSRQAVSGKNLLLQKNVKSGEYLFSHPLASSATLVIALSGQKIDETLSSAKKNAFYMSLLSFISVVGLLILYLHSRIFELDHRKIAVGEDDFSGGGTGTRRVRFFSA